MEHRIWARWPLISGTVPLRDTWRDFSERHGLWAPWLVMAIYAGCLTAFVADMTSVTPLAFGVFYAPLVATGIFHDDKRAPWFLATLASVMVVMGALFPALNPDLFALIWNRTLSLCAVFATAAFVGHARRIQDRLAEQTQRAESAELIKTEVLTNLSQEIRTPLHAMIGVLELIAADSRSEHKAALGMVRSSGRRLVTTVDNLVDLTQFEGQTMPAEPVDLGMLLRQTAEASRADAVARQIELRIDISSPDAPPINANPWAVRRILENLIGDAIIYTAPGGQVMVRVIHDDHHVTAEVIDTGTRPPGALQSALDPNITRLMPSVMGLALSQRLARAMEARLTFNTVNGDRTIARFMMPAVPAADQASR